MNNENKKIVKDLKELIASEVSKYEYTFDDDRNFVKDVDKYIANMVLEHLKNGDIEPPFLPYVMNVIDRDNKEIVIMFYKNLDSEFTYQIITSPIIEIDTTAINP